jgi:hypothetical protein
MRRALRRFYLTTFLALAVATLVTLSLLQPVFGTRADFSIYNGRWNGARDLAADLYGSGALLPGFSVSLGDEGGEGVTIVQRSFAEFDLDPRATSLVLLGPAQPPNAEEGAWLRAFVEGGGRVLLADDFGAGDAHLAALGAGARFDGGLVLDLSFVKRPAFVVAADVAPHPATQGVREVVLAHATALREGPATAVLARTGPSSWIDEDGDGLRDAGEAGGPFPWLAVEPVGAGEVLLLSDPSVLINGMGGLADNAALRAAIIAWLTEGGRSVLIDESHHAHVDPVKVLGATLRVALALGVAAAFLLFALGPSLRIAPRQTARRLLRRLLPEPPPPARDLLAQVRERHPDWDENTLRAILAAKDAP